MLGGVNESIRNAMVLLQEVSESICHALSYCLDCILDIE